MHIKIDDLSDPRMIAFLEEHLDDMRRISRHYRVKGIGSKLLEHITNYAVSNNITTLSLETGSMSFFEPAHRLYLKHGFVFCEPFSDYKEDSFSL